jgi:ABC-type nitrate/sulfonate/bicarbonate transport system permease component
MTNVSEVAPAGAAESGKETSGRLLGRFWRTRLSGVLLIALLLALWEASARLGWIESRSWPRFTTVVANTVDGIMSGDLVDVLLSTLYRMLIGFTIGSTIGIAGGIFLGAVPALYRYINPLVEIVRPLPSPAIIPPLILFLGVDDALKIFIVSLATFFPVFVNTVGGVRGTNAVLLQTAATFRLGSAEVMRKVILPSALPAIFSGLRISLAMALVVAVVSEMVSGASGMGYFIIQTQYAMQPEAMYSAVLCLALTGYLLNRLFLLVERRLLPWYGA